MPKRHWRTAEGEHALKGLGVGMSVRSRLIFENKIAAPLIEEGTDPAVVRAIVVELQNKLLGQSAKRVSKKGGRSVVEGRDEATTSVSNGCDGRRVGDSGPVGTRPQTGRAPGQISAAGDYEWDSICAAQWLCVAAAPA